jgi:ubiquitin-protein ligase/DNA-directed RNA polymerase subunit RPC12/RpoP
MITFNCGQCGKSFTVADEYAGRSARCKTCGNMVTVPFPAATLLEASKPTKVPMRIRRLRADAEAMAGAFRDSPFIRTVPFKGSPAEVYHIEYTVRGLERGKDGKPIPRESHKVEIQLTSEYPRVSPMCKMLTPIFHPNIDPATICVGDHWTAGERLSDLVIRIGQMIAYQEYNIKSPLDAEAAMWADLNRADLPVDPRDLRPAGA